MPRILLVDDDPPIRDVLSVALPLEWPGVSVVTASDGDEALRVFRDQEPDVVILAVALPGLSGFEVLGRIRQVSDATVIMLSRLGDEIHQVRGFQLGADDYVVKPVTTRVLTARIRAVLRRNNPSPRAGGTPDLEVGPLALSLDRHEVSVQGQPIHLTPVEFTLLHLLARNAGQVLTYATLMTRIWGPDSYRTADQLRVCVSRLHSKIERLGGPRCIENKRGVGYRLVRPLPR
jgi:DNA-binding response OmpR family regulator